MSIYDMPFRVLFADGDGLGGGSGTGDNPNGDSGGDGSGEDKFTSTHKEDTVEYWREKADWNAKQAKEAFEKRDKANKEREKYKDYNDIKKKLEDIENEKLTKDGDYQALLEKQKKELEDLKSKSSEAEAYKERLDKYEKSRKKELLEELPEQHKAFAKDLDLDKLVEYVKLNKDSGKGTANTNGTKATGKTEGKPLTLSDTGFYNNK